VSISQTFTPASDTHDDSLAAGSLLLAAFLTVIIFLPGEGRIAGPLHDALYVLLGRAAFMLPLGLALFGALLIVRRLRPGIAFPRRRIAGVGLLALAVLPSEHLLGGDQAGTGAIGQWLLSTFVDLFGEAATLLILVVLLGAGIRLAFDVKMPRNKPVAVVHTDAES
jgi:hypothetical protein